MSPVQLRGAISTQHLKADTDCNTSPQRHPTGWRQADAGMDLEAEGLDCLEDSLIGNDVVLAECKRHSQNLHAALQPVMFKDRFVFSPMQRPACAWDVVCCPATKEACFCECGCLHGVGAR